MLHLDAWVSALNPAPSCSSSALLWNFPVTYLLLHTPATCLGVQSLKRTLLTALPQSVPAFLTWVEQCLHHMPGPTSASAFPLPVDLFILTLTPLLCTTSAVCSALFSRSLDLFCSVSATRSLSPFTFSLLHFISKHSRQAFSALLWHSVCLLQNRFPRVRAVRVLLLPPMVLPRRRCCTAHHILRLHLLVCCRAATTRFRLRTIAAAFGYCTAAAGAAPARTRRCRAAPRTAVHFEWVPAEQSRAFWSLSALPGVGACTCMQISCLFLHMLTWVLFSYCTSHHPLGTDSFS